MVRLKLTIGRQYYIVRPGQSTFDPTTTKVIEQFCEQFTIRNDWSSHIRYKKPTTPNLKKYYAKRQDGCEYRFNIHSLREFLERLTVYGIKPTDTQIDRIPPIEPISVDTMAPSENYTPREDQKPYIDYLVTSEYPTNLLNLQTGKGKTFIALYSLCQLKQRVLFSTLPRFMEKWVDDVVNYTNLTRDDIAVISGRNGIIEYLSKDPKPFTIISNRTYVNFIKSYEEEDDISFTYPITPDEFICWLRPGIVLFDEVHLDFSSFFRIMLYANVQKMIGLSATLEHLDQRQNKLYYYLYPHDYRPKSLDYDRYIDVYQCGYRIHPRYRIRYLSGNKYSQHTYEQSIIRYDRLLRGYLEMIDHYLHKGFLSRYENGDRCLIFASSVKMCTIITDYLKEKHPNMDIRRYVQDDPYENIIEATVCVTTIISGGTAIDIKNLTTVIQTISVVSIQSNKQSLGRLRRLDNKDCRFYYLYNKDLSPHRYTNTMREQNLKPIARSFNRADYFQLLGE